MEGNMSIKISKKLIVRIISVVFACFFFIPTMMVSCSSYGLADDDLMKVDVSAKTVTFGTSVMGSQVDGAGWTIISLLIPIIVFAVLFIKHKASVIIGILLTICNNVLYVMYASSIKEKAAENYANFSYMPGFYILMVFFGVYYLLSLLCLLYDKEASGVSSQGGTANEFLGNLGQRISATSQEAVQKTKDMANIMSLNNENSGLDKKNDSIQKQIGSEIYEQIFRTKSIDDVKRMGEDNTIPSDLWNQVCEFVIQIKQNELAKVDNERKILELKGELPCPKCGKMIPKGAMFCSGCGEKSPYVERSQDIDESEANKSDERVCPTCGKPLLADAAFCKYCGTKIV